jgi:multiple sugar transport system substrate-binding protein
MKLGFRKHAFIVTFLLIFTLVLASSSVVFGAEKVTLKVLRPGYPQEARVFFNELQEALREELPHITLEIIDADWNTFHSRVPVWVAGGQEPDIYLCSPTQVGGFSDIGALLPLDDMVDDELYNDIPAGAWEAVRYKGSFLGVPGGYAPFVLWYNKDIYAQAGLNPDEPPTTWDELLDYALQIKKNTSVAPIGVGLGRSLDFNQLIWGMLFYSATNEQFVDENGYPTFNSEYGIAAGQFLTDLVLEHKVSQPNPELYSKGDLRLLFRDGEIAMLVDGPWILNTLDESYDLSSEAESAFGITTAPQSFFTDKTPLYSATIDSWVISANTKYPEEAKQVLRFLLRPEWQYSHDINVQQMSFRNSIFENLDQYPDADHWVYRQMHAMLENTMPFQPILPTAPTMFDEILDAAVKMTTGVASVEQALEEAAEAIKVLNNVD